MLVKCISPRLNHIVFGKDGNGKNKPHKVQVGETFKVKSIPASWRGLVVAVEGPTPEAKVAVTNPAQDEELAALKAEYKEKAGRAAHHMWGVDEIKAKLAELA